MMNKKRYLLFLCLLTLSVVLLVQKPEKILKDSPRRIDFEKYSTMLNKQADEAVASKDYRLAVKILQEWVAMFDKYPKEIQQMYDNALGSVYYNMACYESLLQNKQEALNALAKALACGWHDYSHTRQDSDLDFIRNEQEFKKLMQAIREKGDYLYILRQSGEYVKGDSNCRNMEFTYMNSADPQLVRVRHYFNLDSIAGSGDEISRIKNLMTWVHDAVRHDGSSDNPKSKNAIDMVNLCRKEKRGVNCRMMAQILNECYLAMGFKSRFVTCMPKVYESDCHVINVVYSDSLQKWIWMDPTFNAWVADENGSLLGIAEVRMRLQKGLPLILNEEANWNHETKQTKEKYLESYMAKNLYYLNCSLRSEYNAETYYAGKKRMPYVSLIPCGYQLEHNNQSQYVTNDDEWFWQVPALYAR